MTEDTSGIENAPADSLAESGKALRDLRVRHNLSMRQLAQKAGVAVSYVSGVEAGRISPTISTLRKLLHALETDLGAFFTELSAAPEEMVFRHAAMKTVVDPTRTYRFVLPRHPNIHLEILEEVVLPDDQIEYETLTSDLAGYVQSGVLYFEVQSESPKLLYPGDAFYVPAGNPVRGYGANNESAHVITMYVPPRY